MKYKVTFREWKTGEKTVVFLSRLGLELCDYLARNGGLNLVEDKGYYYHFEDFSKALKKLSSGPEWEYFKNY
jgi:hypothetical protein